MLASYSPLHTILLLLDPVTIRWGGALLRTRLLALDTRKQRKMERSPKGGENAAPFDPFAPSRRSSKDAREHVPVRQSSSSVVHAYVYPFFTIHMCIRSLPRMHGDIVRVYLLLVLQVVGNFRLSSFNASLVLRSMWVC